MDMTDQGGPGGGCCGLIVLVLAVIGAIQVYHYVTEPDGCGGAAAWVEQTNDLFEDLDREGRALDPRSSSRADVLAYVDHLRHTMRTQLASFPPAK